MPSLIRTSLFLVGSLLVACAPPSATTAPTDPVEQVQINGTPTGSITVPSLCERPATDLQVTQGGADSFAVLWADDHYQLVYADLLKQDVYAVKLGTNGAPIGQPVVVDSGPGAATLPSLLATPSGFVVAWQEVDMGATTQGSVRVHALDKDGTPVGATQLVAMGRSAQMRPVVAASPLGLVVSWMDQAPTETEDLTSVGESFTTIALLDDQLQVRSDIPAKRVNQASHAGYPWLAGNEKGLALLWSDDAGGRTDPYFAPVDTTLTMMTTTDVRDEAATNAALLGRLAQTDFGYIAAWEDLRSGEAEIYMAQLDASGKRVTGGLVEEPGTGNANWPHMAWTGSTSAVVYYQFRNGKPQIFMSFLDANGERVGGSADAQISNTPGWARYPDIAWTGSEFGVMWIDARGEQPEVFFNRAACKRPSPI